MWRFSERDFLLRQQLIRRDVATANSVHDSFIRREFLQAKFKKLSEIPGDPCILSQLKSISTEIANLDRIVNLNLASLDKKKEWESYDARYWKDVEELCEFIDNTKKDNYIKSQLNDYFINNIIPRALKIMEEKTLEQSKELISDSLIKEMVDKFYPKLEEELNSRLEKLTEDSLGPIFHTRIVDDIIARIEISKKTQIQDIAALKITSEFSEKIVNMATDRIVDSVSKKVGDSLMNSVIEEVIRVSSNIIELKIADTVKENVVNNLMMSITPRINDELSRIMKTKASKVQAFDI